MSEGILMMLMDFVIVVSGESQVYEMCVRCVSVMLLVKLFRPLFLKGQDVVYWKI